MARLGLSVEHRRFGNLIVRTHITSRRSITDYEGSGALEKFRRHPPFIAAMKQVGSTE